MNSIQDILKFLLPVLIIFGPAIGAIIKKLAAAAEKKKAEVARQRREMDALRTGRVGAGQTAGPVAPAPALDARESRNAEIAARRKQQLEELRRRRQQSRPTAAPQPEGAEIAIGPDGGLILRIPGASGPVRPAPPQPQRGLARTQQPPRRNGAERPVRQRSAHPAPLLPPSVTRTRGALVIEEDEVHRLVPDKPFESAPTVAAAARAGLPPAVLAKLGITSLRGAVILGEIIGPPAGERLRF